MIIKIMQYDPIYSDATVSMWRESKEKAIGQKEIHSFSEQKYYLDEILCKTCEVVIATEGVKVLGMIAFTGEEVIQLYIHNDYQRRGIGKTLLNLAKNKSEGRLTLYTFEVNYRARTFYERNGFEIIGRGHENEERLDDIEYEWIQKSN